MPAQNTSNYSRWLKQFWTKNKKLRAEMLLNEQVFSGLLTKDSSWAGDTYQIPFGYGMTNGYGSTLNSAQANKNPRKVGRWDLTDQPSYSLFSVDRRVMKKSRNTEGAVEEALGYETKGAMERWARMDGLYLFGNGGGALGQIESVSANTLVLTSSDDVRKFDEGMRLNASTDDGTGGADILSGSPAEITAVNVSTRTLTFGQNVVNIIPGIAANQYLFFNGTYGAVVKGLRTWCRKPSEWGTNDTLFGVNRSTNRYKFESQYVQLLSRTIRNGFKLGAKESHKAGGKISHIITSPDNFLTLSNELEAAGALIMTKAPAASIGGVDFGVQYDGISFAGPKGKVTVVADYNCVNTFSFGLNLDRCVYASIGEAPEMEDKNGEVLTEANSDSYEGRFIAYSQFGISWPGETVLFDHTA